MVDLDRIHQRLELLAGYLRELRRLRDLPAAEYLRDEVYAGRYLVQVAAQTCIDLANHVSASEGWRAPRDFGDSFTVLHEHGVIDDVSVHEALAAGVSAVRLRMALREGTLTAIRLRMALMGWVWHASPWSLRASRPVTAGSDLLMQRGADRPW